MSNVSIPPQPTKTTRSLEYQLLELKSNWFHYLFNTTKTIVLLTVSSTTLYYTYNKIHTIRLKRNRSNRYIDSDDYKPITTVDRIINSVTERIDNSDRSDNEQKQPTIDESELLQFIDQSTDTITESTVVTDELTQYLHTTLLQLDCSTLSYNTRISIARYLILYHTYYNGTANDIHESQQLDTQSQNILHKINTVLQFNDIELHEVQQRTVVQLLLDTAIKLKHYTAIYTLIQQMLAFNNTSTGLSLEEQLIIFTSCIYVGQWELLYQYGQLILQQRDDLSDFHLASEHNALIPDYQCLYDITSQYHNIEYSVVEQLQYTQCYITSMRIKLSNVECLDVKRADSVRALLIKQHTLQWQYKDMTESDILIIHGAVAQCQSKAAEPCNMYGPVYNNKIHLIGYRTNTLDTHTSTSDTEQSYDTVLKQQEEYILEQSDTDIYQYTGLYKVTQSTYMETFEDDIVPNQSQISVPVVVVFDMRITLQPV